MLSIIDSHRKLSILKIYTRKVCLKDCTSITFLTSTFSCTVQVRICANFYSNLSNIPDILSSGLSLKAQRVLAGTSRCGEVGMILSVQCVLMDVDVVDYENKELG
jgi:hypothetical protein